MKLLYSKVAIVTGGVQGFGLAVVERFLNSGANVVIWENDKKLLDEFQTLDVWLDVVDGGVPVRVIDNVIGLL